MNKGIALVLVTFLVAACSLVAVVAFSLLAQGTTTGLGLSESMQAYAIAVGGKEWYLEQLEADNDWTDEASQADIALGPGSFDIVVNSVSANSVSFTVTGAVTGYVDQTVQRQISLSAKRLPKASRFAVFWGEDTGSNLQLKSSTINGNFWSRGNTDVDRRSLVSGISYCPDIRSITGDGTFTEQKINLPYPDMPQIEQTSYNDLMNFFDSYINSYGTGSDIGQNSDLVLNGEIIGCRDFITDRNITISGYGYIVASRDILLHSDRKDRGTLTISPSGGNIYFLAGENIVVNSTDRDTNIFVTGDVNNAAYLYSRAQTAESQLVDIQGNSRTTTNITSAFILARRCIIVEDGSDLSACTLYVSVAPSGTNFLQITDSGTTVSGNIISLSRQNPGLIINNSASVTGFIYHWGDNTGYTTLDRATINGSVIASQFGNSNITNSTITYVSSGFFANPPDGFNGYVMAEPNSWDDH